jgi:hypothetical protein
MTHPLVLLRELAAGKTPRLALLARVDLHSGAPLFPPSLHRQDGGREGGRERGRDIGGRAHNMRRGGGGEHHHERRQHQGHHGHPGYPHHYAPQPQYMTPQHFQPSGGGLGESLFPLVLARVGDGQSAGKVTGLLLQLANPSAVLALIQGPPQMLDEAVAEAVCMLGGHSAKVGGAPLRPPAAAASRGAAARGAAACVACAPCGQTGSGGGEASTAEVASEAEAAEAEAETEAEAAVEVSSAAAAEASVAEATATVAAAAGDESEHRGDGAVADGMVRCAITSGDKVGS